MPVDPSTNPFAALTMVAAPAILTNACSVLAMSTSNRFLRASDRMRSLHSELESVDPNSSRARLVEIQVPRIEKQSVLLLSGLASAYVGLGSFSAAALISLIGAAASAFQELHTFSHATVFIGLLCGFIGVCAIVFGCTRLFQATQLSVLNIRDEAACIRESRAATKLQLGPQSPNG